MFCAWKAGECSKGPFHLKTGQQGSSGPPPPSAFLSLTARTPGCGPGTAFPRRLLSRLYLGCFWDFMHVPFCLLSQQLFGQFFTIYSDSWLFIADWQVFDLGTKGGAGKVYELETWSS